MQPPVSYLLRSTPVSVSYLLRPSTLPPLPQSGTSSDPPPQSVTSSGQTPTPVSHLLRAIPTSTFVTSITSFPFDLFITTCCPLFSPPQPYTLFLSLHSTLLYWTIILKDEGSPQVCFCFCLLYVGAKSLALFFLPQHTMLSTAQPPDCPPSPPA